MSIRSMQAIEVVARRLVPLALLPFLWASVARAQSVRGRVLRGADSTPVPGAIVILVDSAGADVARALADPRGAYVLHAPAAGAYRVRTLRIGYHPSLGPVFQLGKGATSDQSVVVSEIPVMLEAVKVNGKEACRTDPAEGSTALTLWTEARKALLAAVLSSDGRGLTVSIAHFDRRLDTTEHVTSQRVRIERGPSRRPFYTLTAEEFERRGYTESDATGTTYRAPDAEVLLADVFGANHCLRVIASPRSPAPTAGLIGLGFAPAHERPGVTDVTGTLWLDRRTAELRSLEFGYTGIDREFSDAGGGGRLEFARLPSGAWVISRWQLRLPVLARVHSVTSRIGGGGSLGQPAVERVGETKLRVAYVQVAGGALLSAAESGQPEWLTPLPDVSGVVLYTPEQRPVSGARVELSGTDYTAVTDSLGRFHIAGVVPGRYGAAASSPVLDSLGAAPEPARNVDVGESGPVWLRLDVPTAHGAIATLCGGARLRSSDQPALLHGTVTGPDGRGIGADREVAVRWLKSVNVTGAAVDAGYETQRTRTNEDSQFTVCSVPAGKRLRIDVSRRSGWPPVPADSVTILPGREWEYVVVKLPSPS